MANSAREGKIGALVAVRHVISLLHVLEKELPQKDFLTLRGVDSESDDLPLGPERRSWAADSLKAKDLIAAEYESRVRENVLMALANIAKTLEAG